MKLHQFCRYYTTRLWIGTPPQMFALIVDSGSTVTYVPCSDCEQCGKHQVMLKHPNCVCLRTNVQIAENPFTKQAHRSSSSSMALKISPFSENFDF